MVFQPELAFEGIRNGFNPLTTPPKAAEPWGFVFAIRPQQGSSQLVSVWPRIGSRISRPSSTTTTVLPPTERQTVRSWATSSPGITGADPTNAPAATHPCTPGPITTAATKNSRPHDQKIHQPELSQKLDERTASPERCAVWRDRPHEIGMASHPSTGNSRLPAMLYGLFRVASRLA